MTRPSSRRMAGSVRVEEPHDVRPDAGLAARREHQRLPEALRFVVARSRADRIDVAPVRLRLGMDERVAVHLGGRHEQEPRAHLMRDVEQPERAQRVGPHRVDRHAVVVDRAGRRRQVGDDVHLRSACRDVGVDELVRRIVKQVGDVRAVAGGQIVHADDAWPACSNARLRWLPMKPAPPAIKSLTARLSVARTPSKRAVQRVQRRPFGRPRSWSGRRSPNARHRPLAPNQRRCGLSSRRSSNSTARRPPGGLSGPASYEFAVRMSTAPPFLPRMPRRAGSFSPAPARAARPSRGRP